jgi:hypothetical protein
MVAVLSLDRWFESRSVKEMSLRLLQQSAHTSSIIKVELMIRPTSAMIAFSCAVCLVASSLLAGVFRQSPGLFNSQWFNDG